jgi:hypothetical protein
MRNEKNKELLTVANVYILGVGQACIQGRARATGLQLQGVQGQIMEIMGSLSRKIYTPSCFAHDLAYRPAEFPHVLTLYTLANEV